MLRTLVKKWLLRRGMVLSRPPGQFVLSDYKLQAARRRGLAIGSILDGGAARGDWARAIHDIWPDAKILCVEPRQDVQEALARVKQSIGNVEIAATLLGATQGEVEFFVTGDRSSMLKDFAGAGGRVEKKPITTMDALVQSTAFGFPDLIKLDLQGAERAALDGATECLKRAQAVLLELSFIEFEPGMPVFAEMIAYMQERGFRIYDVLGLWHRPLDGALAQGDFLFLRADHPLLSDRRYSAN